MFELEIAEVVKETNDTISVSFIVPEELKENFEYTPGQYMTFEAIIDGEKIRRSYSLCSNPYAGEQPRVAIKRVNGGRFSNFANDHFTAGGSVNVLSPRGNFVANVAPWNAKQYILFAAGSGITPILSILKAVLSQEPNSKVKLVYANSNTENIIFDQEINEQLKSSNDSLQRIDHISSIKGRLSAEDVVEYSGGESNATYFMCGPQGFMETIESALVSSGVSAEKINKEYFQAKQKNEPAQLEVEELSDEIIDRDVVVVVDGEEKTIHVPADENILEAAIDNDMDPPYSCQAGVCTTCRAMCVSGKVMMDESEGLSEEEIEEGYVLACQAHPLTDNVRLEFTL